MASFFSYRQCGMTLVECLAAVAISSVILVGLSHTLTIALQGFEASKQASNPQGAEQTVMWRNAMRRISWAMDTADRKKTSQLSLITNATRSGNLFDRYDPVKKQTVLLEYVWTPPTSTTPGLLTEYLSGTPSVAILSNVTDFKVSLLNTSSDVPVVSVSLTVGNAPEQVTLTETRRLGGPW